MTSYIRMRKHAALDTSGHCLDLREYCLVAGFAGLRTSSATNVI
jgi:hypothetical protein